MENTENASQKTMKQHESYKDLREWFTAFKDIKEKKLRTLSLGELIKIQRKRLDMNQRELARASGITPATISRLESGQVKELKSEALKRLADALDITADYLLGRTTGSNLNSMFEIDPNLEHIFHVYKNLSFKKRKELKNFVSLLEQQENKR
ncbi:MAG: helix-turn-helix domain-containing protein [bacterium]